jgi:hypothetical protein
MNQPMPDGWTVTTVLPGDIANVERHFPVERAVEMADYIKQMNESFPLLVVLVEERSSTSV